MHHSEFDKLVAEYKTKVFNTCLGFVKHHEDAQDLAQEVFIEVFRKFDSFRGDSGIGTWLYRIAVNKSLEYLRKKKQIKRGGLNEGMEALLDEPADLFYHPGVSLENKERAGILFHAIGLLPELQQVAFTLQKVEGLSIYEIAKIMDKSVSAVEALLFRAKENLRSNLMGYYGQK